ncbi:acyl-CoA dehydrogenase/oxidase [Aspergillus taichungensis]|uniref:Acyl-CoA dehydrogenase/oxidase n=1 Tax=Aspergillus taichungensis TaxID=482145 RepID=A0A2J5HTC3_9EURO|nr:acyl-CoA dehydrogenase/oxidase [Aspergillus taichungensis]
MSSPKCNLSELALFRLGTESAGADERINISYQRARAVAKTYDMKIHDVIDLSPKFWQLHQDFVAAFDFAAYTLVTIQLNLAAGTLAPFAVSSRERGLLLEDILSFKVSAQYMLTEVGHGLDARNLETTATLLPNGDFDLHTPNSNAAKIMPPSWPRAGFPRVAVVFARLIVQDEARGLRPFIVWLNDGETMCAGVTAKLLFARTGSKPLDHTITTFSHVRLPFSALLGSLETPANERDNFLSITRRIHVGSLALTMGLIPLLKRAVFVAGRYSINRQIGGPKNEPISIISLRTQQQPILYALAKIAVLEAYAQESIRLFQDPTLGPDVKQGIVAAFKAVGTQATHSALFALTARCGARGLYAENHIIESLVDSHGISIAEGDTLALSIRFGTELLLGRYQPPPPKDPKNILARHEKGLLDESRLLLKGISGGHRSSEFNSLILPRCQPIVQAIGHRLAYEAALEAGVDQNLLRLFKTGVMLQDPSWYVQHAGISRESMFADEAQALDSVLPQLDGLLNQTGVQPYCSAPILSQDSWEAFVDQLETREGTKSRALSEISRL